MGNILPFSLLYLLEVALCVLKVPVRVGIERDADIRVPHQVLKGFRVHSSLFRDFYYEPYFPTPQSYRGYNIAARREIDE